MVRRSKSSFYVIVEVTKRPKKKCSRPILFDYYCEREGQHSFLGIVRKIFFLPNHFKRFDQLPFLRGWTELLAVSEKFLSRNRWCEFGILFDSGLIHSFVTTFLIMFFQNNFLFFDIILHISVGPKATKTPTTIPIPVNHLHRLQQNQPRPMSR